MYRKTEIEPDSNNLKEEQDSLKKLVEKMKNNESLQVKEHVNFGKDFENILKHGGNNLKNFCLKS